ncbi:TRAP transporter large permease [Sedimenticola thiotaurini]|nr:TRAP transporter large permease subunit [Sedimenticola thiotaurini]
MEIVALIMFVALFALILTGVQVAFALMAVATVGGLVVFGDSVFHQFVGKIEDVATNFILAAVPLFVFMGAMLERSGIAEDLFSAIRIWTRKLRGGVAVGTVLMAIVFAASTGVVGATESLIGLLAIPPMLQQGYKKSLISGTICAGGSLGTVIPPSIIIILLGPLADVSVGDLMAGMIIPGLLLGFFYLTYVLVASAMGGAGPRLEHDPADDMSLSEKLVLSAKALLPPLVLISAVLGSIVTGAASPTEAAGIGAACAVVLAALHGKLNLRMLWHSLVQTLSVTTMIMFIVLGGSLFTGVLLGTGALWNVQDAISAMDVPTWVLILTFLGIVFAAGFFLEWISILLIFVPIFMPFIKAAGVDPVWFSVLVLITVQTSYMTPPMAPAIFYLRGVAPKEITLKHMYAGVMPFVIIQFVLLGIVAVFPVTVLWLPSILLGF